MTERQNKPFRLPKKSPTPVATVMPRSVSMTTLTTLSPESLKPRITRLESLEAKMASIAVSLSPNDRKKVAATTATNRGDRRLHDANLLNDNLTQLLKETEMLRKGLQEKDVIINTLKEQNNRLLLQNGMKNQESNQNPVLESKGKEVDKREQLLHIQNEIDNKKTVIKNLRLSMDKMEVNDLDARIHQAELEFQLEREELSVLDLQQEQMSIQALIEEQKKDDAETTFFSIISGNSSLSLAAADVQYNPHSPSFAIASHLGSVGLIIQWARDSSGLKKGDRLLEVNGKILLTATRDDLLQVLSKASTSTPLQMVVLRNTPSRKVSIQEMENLKGEISSVVHKLDNKIKENKELHLAVEKLQKDKTKLQKDNLRLSHRISYLEEQANELQQSCEQLKSPSNIYESKTSLFGHIPSKPKVLPRSSSNSSSDGKVWKQPPVKPPRTSISMKHRLTNSGTTSISVNHNNAISNNASLGNNTRCSSACDSPMAMKLGRTGTTAISITRNNSTTSTTSISTCRSSSNTNSSAEDYSVSRRQILNSYSDNNKKVSSDLLKSNGNLAVRSVNNCSSGVNVTRSSSTSVISSVLRSSSTCCVPSVLHGKGNNKTGGICEEASQSDSAVSKGFNSNIHRATSSCDVRLVGSSIIKSHSANHLDHLRTITGASGYSHHVLQVHVPFATIQDSKSDNSVQNGKNKKQGFSPLTRSASASCYVYQNVPRKPNLQPSPSVGRIEYNKMHTIHNLHDKTNSQGHLAIHLKVNNSKIALDDLESENEEWC